MYFYEVRIKWVKMLLDPAISGAIAADRVAWMALAKFNTGRRAIRASGTTCLYPHLSLPTYHHPPPGAELHIAHHTGHCKDKDNDKDKERETTCVFPNLGMASHKKKSSGIYID